MPPPRPLWPALAALAALAEPSLALAEPGAAAPSRLDDLLEQQEAIRKLWDRSVVVGATVGAGAPLGVAGAFAELSPARWLALQGGGGYGLFGAALGGTALWRAFILEDWASMLGVGYSGNLTPGRFLNLADAQIPAVSRWLNLEYVGELRTLGGRTVRLSLGHTFLLNSKSFRCLPPAQQGLGNVGDCSLASGNDNPGFSPYNGGPMDPGEAAVTTTSGEHTHFWYVHLDFGAFFGW